MYKLYLQFEVVQDLTDIKVMTEQHITSNLSIDSEHRNCDSIHVLQHVNPPYTCRSSHQQMISTRTCRRTYATHHHDILLDVLAPDSQVKISDGTQAELNNTSDIVFTYMQYVDSHYLGGGLQGYSLVPSLPNLCSMHMRKSKQRSGRLGMRLGGVYLLSKVVDPSLMMFCSGNS